MTLSTATLLFAVKAAQFSTYFSWAEATSGLVFTHMCQSNPWYMPVNCRESMALSTSECLCPSFFFWDSFGEHEDHFSGAHSSLVPHPSVELSSRAAQAGSCSKSIELLRVFSDLPNQHGCTLGPVIDFCPYTWRQQSYIVLQLRS